MATFPHQTGADFKRHAARDISDPSVSLSFDPDQPRDENGRWADAGGGGAWPVPDDSDRVFGGQPNDYKRIEASGKAWQAGLTRDEEDTLRSYTQTSYGDVNRYLRGGEDVRDAKAFADTITKALDKAKDIPPPAVVWRGLHTDKSTTHGVLAKLNPGDVIRLKGFQSTSVEPSFAKRWSGAASNLIMEIKPKSGAYLGGLTSKNEGEYLLPHNAEYRVVGRKTVNFSRDKRDVIQLEML